LATNKNRIATPADNISLIGSSNLQGTKKSFHQATSSEPDYVLNQTNPNLKGSSLKLNQLTNLGKKTSFGETQNFQNSQYESKIEFQNYKTASGHFYNKRPSKRFKNIGQRGSDSKNVFRGGQSEQIEVNEGTDAYPTSQVDMRKMYTDKMSALQSQTAKPIYNAKNVGSRYKSPQIKSQKPGLNIPKSRTIENPEPLNIIVEDTPRGSIMLSKVKNLAPNSRNSLGNSNNPNRPREISNNPSLTNIAYAPTSDPHNQSQQSSKKLQKSHARQGSFTGLSETQNRLQNSEKKYQIGSKINHNNYMVSKRGSVDSSVRQASIICRQELKIQKEAENKKKKMELKYMYIILQAHMHQFKAAYKKRNFIKCMNYLSELVLLSVELNSQKLFFKIMFF
jgi:hypothetical protein